MSKIIEEHQTLYRLKEKFEQIEAYSLTQPICPVGRYLCIRLDGVKLSKQYLKDSLLNNQFKDAFSQAITACYYLFRWQSEKVNKNFYLCAMALSDEVTFILNDKENYHKNRTFKIGTLLTGALSASMTLYLQPGASRQVKGKQRIELATFDARPLIMESYAEVEDYIRLRWLVGRRNAMCKVLRLEGVFSDRDLYDTPLSNDVPSLTHEVESRGLGGKLRKALSDFRIFVPDEEGSLRVLSPADAVSGIDSSLQDLRAVHRWLNT